MSLVTKKAPDFLTKAVVNGQIKDDFKLSDYKGKYVVLFFYPLDFTFVCPTELHVFQDKTEEFKKRDVEIVAASTDSWFSHLAWLNTPKNKGVKNEDNFYEHNSRSLKTKIHKWTYYKTDSNND